jgi:hypothetical protein
LVIRFLGFRRNALGFDTLFVGSVVSRELAERIQTLHQQMKQRVAPHSDACAASQRQDDSDRGRDFGANRQSDASSSRSGWLCEAARR